MTQWEFGAQFRILGGDTNRAGVGVALARHDTASRNECRGAESKFLRTQHGGNNHVSAGFEAAVGAEGYAAAQVIHNQHLLDLGQADFPRDAGVFNRAKRRGAGASIVAADVDYVGVSFGNARGYGADSGFSNQLYRHFCVGICVL